MKQFRIEIVQQPQTFVKFISKSDVEGNRGSIKNNSLSGFVKIIAQHVGNGSWADKVHVLVTAMHKKSENDYIPSRFSIQKCGIQHKMINWNLFTDELRQVESKQFEYELKNAFVFAPYDKKHNAIQFPNLYKEIVFKEKYKRYLQFIEGVNEIDLIHSNYYDKIEELCRESCHKKYANNIYLAFQLYAQDPTSQCVTLLSDTIYSDVICNGNEEFSITRLCNTHVPSDGKSEMTILLSDAKDVKIHFIDKGKKQNTRKQVQWEHEQTEYTTHQRNAAVTFKVPPRACDPDDLVVPCVLCVECTVEGTSDTVKARPVEFYYVNINFEEEQRNRKRGKLKLLNSPQVSSEVFGTIDAEDSIIKSIKIFRELLDSSDQNWEAHEITYGQFDNAHAAKYGTSLFFDALEKEKLHLFTSIGSSSLNKYMAELKDDMLQTLLHRACEFNLHRDVLSLVKIGCPIASPCPRTFQTPLHIAIDRRHKECVAEFMLVIQNFRELGVSGTDVDNLMLHHDYKGYTIAHAAAANGLQHLTKTIFRYCYDANIDILNMKALTCQNSILGLAELNGHKSIEDVILFEIKQSNYKSQHGSINLDLPTLGILLINKNLMKVLALSEST